jgi:hypothetical protein
MFPNVGVPCVSVLEFYDIKKLYHFFDKQGIYLTVEMITRDMWVYTVSLDNGIVIAPCQDSKKRREDIEVEGFYECFRLLESKLRNSYI